MAHQRCLRLVIFLLFASVTFLPSHGQDAPLSGFDDYVNKALREWEVPHDPRLSAKPRFVEAIVSD